MVACRAYGLRPIDGPFGDFPDADGYTAAARALRVLGCEGKWAIHPRQVALANEVFTPSEAEVTKARRILEAMAKAAKEGGGAVSLDGRLIDIASIRMAEALIPRPTRCRPSKGLADVRSIRGRSETSADRPHPYFDTGAVKQRPPLNPRVAVPTPARTNAPRPVAPTGSSATMHVTIEHAGSRDQAAAQEGRRAGDADVHRRRRFRRQPQGVLPHGRRLGRLDRHRPEEGQDGGVLRHADRRRSASCRSRASRFRHRAFE